MKKKTVKYGVIDIPQGSAICILEKGGDKNNKAGYRFSDTDKRTDSRTVQLVTDELTLPDLYGATWVYTKKGWLKAENHITWYDTYKEANNALSDLTGRKKRTLWIIAGIAIAVVAGYLLYKYKKNAVAIPQMTETPTIETNITDEIPLD